MPSRSPSRSFNGHIDKLDFDENRRKKPSSTHHGSDQSGPSGLLRDDDSLLSDIVDGVIERDRRKLKRLIAKSWSFASAILSWWTRLHYSQFQVNAVSITAELALYLPAPFVGYLCDRYNPRPISLLSAILFGGGYLLAALTYRSVDDPESHSWPFGVMILAFVGVGMGTNSMYLSAVTTCAKNFGRGKHKGVALALPIAAFGLSGMWQSQVGSRLLYERDPDTGGKGDVDVFRFFIFLAGLLFAVGLIGAMALKVFNEEELIDEAVSELERSGLLEDSSIFQRSLLHDSSDVSNNNRHGYGTLTPPSDPATETSSCHSSKDTRKKIWLINMETRIFLTDSTMWLFAAGFFLVTGPGDAFINNLGTILSTLYPPPFHGPPPSNSPATNVSIVALTSTLARLLTGTVSDLLAPTKIHRSEFPSSAPRRLTVSRVSFLLFWTALFSLGQLLLASGLVQRHPPLFAMISTLQGLGYGAAFSLTPIIISVVWGVQNFGTNWGLVAMLPAGGAAVWGAVYSAVYQASVDRQSIMEREETSLVQLDSASFNGRIHILPSEAPPENDGRMGRLSDPIAWR
ncbi:MAG: hypothetical protein Q9195_005306 [Heterodermia aff. obscurata]